MSIPECKSCSYRNKEFGYEEVKQLLIAFSCNKSQTTTIFRKLNLTRNVWIGLMDLNRNGAWTWVNGSNAAKKDIHWAPGEPNNRLKEFYGMIYGNHHQNVSKRLMTNNHYCWEEQQALCEKPI